MKARSFLASVLMSLLFISLSFAQQPTTPQSLIGEWMVSAKHTSGATITTSIRLTQDSKFTATTTVNEQPLTATRPALEPYRLVALLLQHVALAPNPWTNGLASTVVI